MHVSPDQLDPPGLLSTVHDEKVVASRVSVMQTLALLQGLQLLQRCFDGPFVAPEGCLGAGQPVDLAT